MYESLKYSLSRVDLEDESTVDPPDLNWILMLGETAISREVLPIDAAVLPVLQCNSSVPMYACTVVAGQMIIVNQMD